MKKITIGEYKTLDGSRAKVNYIAPEAFIQYPIQGVIFHKKKNRWQEITWTREGYQLTNDKFRGTNLDLSNLSDTMIYPGHYKTYSGRQVKVTGVSSFSYYPVCGYLYHEGSDKWISNGWARDGHDLLNVTNPSRDIDPNSREEIQGGKPISIIIVDMQGRKPVKKIAIENVTAELEGRKIRAFQSVVDYFSLLDRNSEEGKACLKFINSMVDE